MMKRRFNVSFDDKTVSSSSRTSPTRISPDNLSVSSSDKGNKLIETSQKVDEKTSQQFEGSKNDVKVSSVKLQSESNEISQGEECYIKYARAKENKGKQIGEPSSNLIDEEAKKLPANEGATYTELKSVHETTYPIFKKVQDLKEERENTILHIKNQHKQKGENVKRYKETANSEREDIDKKIAQEKKQVESNPERRAFQLLEMSAARDKVKETEARTVRIRAMEQEHKKIEQQRQEQALSSNEKSADEKSADEESRVLSTNVKVKSSPLEKKEVNLIDKVTIFFGAMFSKKSTVAPGPDLSQKEVVDVSIKTKNKKK